MWKRRDLVSSKTDWRLSTQVTEMAFSDEKISLIVAHAKYTNSLKSKCRAPMCLHAVCVCVCVCVCVSKKDER